MKIYAIRVKRIRSAWPKEVPCPWRIGDFQQQYHNAYGGPNSLRSVEKLSQATFYNTKEEAQRIIDDCSYSTTFEVVEFKRTTKT